MTELAPERRAALRCLYVDHNASVNVLATFSRFSESTLEAVIKKAGWVPSGSLHCRKPQIDRAIENIMAEIGHCDTSIAELEKAGRAVVSLVKAKEALEAEPDKPKKSEEVIQNEKQETLNVDNIERFIGDIEKLVAEVEAKSSTATGAQ